MAIYHPRHGARLLRRSPAFTLVAVASLVVGLAGAVGLFTAINAMLFRPLLSDSAATILVVRTTQSAPRENSRIELHVRSGKSFSDPR